MARLPTLDDLGARPTPVSNRSIASNGQAGAVGAAVSNLGETVSKIGQYFADKEDKLDGAKAKAALIKGSLDLQKQLQDDPDYETAEQRYAEGMKKVRDEAAGLIRNGGNRRAFEADSEIDAMRGAVELSKYVAGRRSQARVGVLTDLLATSQDIGQDALDDATREQNIANVQAAIIAVRDRGDITPERASELQRSWTQNYVLQQVQVRADRGDIDGAERYFQANKWRIDPGAEMRLGEQIQGKKENRENLLIVDELFQAPAAPAGAMGVAGVQSLASVPVPASGKPPAANLARMVEITAVSESGNRERVNGRLVTSPVGAQGRMQVMPATARNPGYGIRPWDGKSDEDRSRVGRELLGKLVQRHNGDAAKAWASYNWDSSGNRVDRAVAKWGNEWLKHTPAETQAYVAKNVKALGGTTVAAGPNTYGGPVGPDVKDLETRIEARAQAEGWSPERKDTVRKMAMARANDMRVSAEREREENFNQALAKADALGGTFTEVSQLGDAFYRASAPDQHRLRSMAEANLKAMATGSEVPANGDAIRPLHVMAIEDPAKFAKINLAEYRPHMTAAEFDEISTSQARARVEAAKPADGEKPWNPRTGIQAAISWGEQFGGVEIRDGEEKYRAYRFMEGRAREWSAANGGKAPTENEYQQFFREATSEIKVTNTFMGIPTSTNTTRGFALPTAHYRGVIERQFQAQFGRKPTEAEVITWFKRMGEPLK